MLKLKNLKKAAAFLLAAIPIALAANAIPNISASAETLSSSAAQDIGKAYYADDYDYLDDEDSVFQSLTWEEAVYLFEQDGTYLILLGGAWCANTTAVIDYINDAAKAAGVETVYNLDFRLDGTSQNSHIREDSPTYDGTEYNYLYGELVSRYLTNLDDWVAYTSDGNSALTYNNSRDLPVTVAKVQVPFLFIYDRNNAVNNAPNGTSEEGKTYPVVYGFEKMVYRDSQGGKDLYTSSGNQTASTRVSDYADQLDSAIFSHIGKEEGQITLSSFTDADYIRLSYNEKSGTDIFSEDEPINIETVTYKQLLWLLKREGNYLILFGGSWCGNTQAAIRIINDYAVANHVTVYNFDTKLDGGYAKEYWGYKKDLHIRDNSNEFAKLYVDFVNTYLTNIETEYTIESGNYIFYKDAGDNEITANKLQVPYFFSYNKAAFDKDGHDAPILAYTEKMYLLTEGDSAYIYDENNYADYTMSVYRVIQAYAREEDLEAKDIVLDRTAAVFDPTDKDLLNGKSETKYVSRIVAAVLGVVVLAAVVAIVEIGQRRKFSEKVAASVPVQEPQPSGEQAADSPAEEGAEENREESIGGENTDGDSGCCC